VHGERSGAIDPGGMYVGPVFRVGRQCVASDCKNGRIHKASTEITVSVKLILPLAAGVLRSRLLKLNLAVVPTVGKLAVFPVRQRKYTTKLLSDFRRLSTPYGTLLSLEELEERLL
jgi:hypothetical protein